MPRIYRRRSSRNVRRYRYRKRYGVGKRRSYSRTYKTKRRYSKKALTGFPSHSKTVKLRYTDVDTPTLSFQGGLTTVQWRLFRINSPFDCNPQIASVSCPGFSQHAAIYVNYLVTYVKLRCTFTLAVGSPAFFVGCVLRPVYQEGNWSTWKQWRDLKGNPIPHMVKLTSASEGGKGTVTCVVKAPLWKLIGNKTEYYGSGFWKALSTGNPSTLMEGFVYALTPAGGAYSNTYEIACQTEITMWTKFYNKRKLDS